MKKIVLIIASYYIPGFKGGGPVQSLKNMVENLSDKIDFYIVAFDRDLGDKKTFDNIEIDKWIKSSKSHIYYTEQKKLSWKKINKIIHTINYDLLYLNSFFSYKNSIMPIILKKLKRIPGNIIVLAPRGEFSPEALKLKNLKKLIYISFSKFFKLYNNIKWHASSDLEKQHIQSVFGNNIDIVVASNLTANYQHIKYNKNIIKKPGELKILFLSRIHQKKNLLKALELLRELKGNVDFNIYGHLEDTSYWNRCRNVIDCMPDNIKVKYNGILDHDKTMELFKSHHIFFLPTLGENFGHAISEALIGGCPVVISDKTPWRNLEEDEVGWDINLDNNAKFIWVLQDCINMDQERYNFISKKAFDYAKSLSNREEDKIKMYNMFLSG